MIYNLGGAVWPILYIKVIRCPALLILRGRTIKVGGTTYNALVEQGVIVPVKATYSKKAGKTTSPKKQAEKIEFNPLTMDTDKGDADYLILLDPHFDYLEDEEVQEIADIIKDIDPTSDVRLVFGFRDKSIEGKFFAENEEIRETYNKTIKQIPEREISYFMMSTVLFIKHDNFIPEIVDLIVDKLGWGDMGMPVSTGLLQLENGEQAIVYKYDSYQ